MKANHRRKKRIGIVDVDQILLSPPIGGGYKYIWESSIHPRLLGHRVNAFKEKRTKEKRQGKMIQSAKQSEN